MTLFALISLDLKNENKWEQGNRISTKQKFITQQWLATLLDSPIPQYTFLELVWTEKSMYAHFKMERTGIMDTKWRKIADETFTQIKHVN